MYGLEDYTRIKHVMSYIGVSLTSADDEDPPGRRRRRRLRAFAAIAARRDFFETIVVADYDLAKAEQRRERGRPVRRRAGRRVVRGVGRRRCAASTASPT